RRHVNYSDELRLTRQVSTVYSGVGRRQTARMRLRRLLGAALLDGALLTVPTSAAADPRGADCPPPDPATPKQQLRAEWIASVTNIDWPSRPGLSAGEQQAELLRWYDEAVD